MCVIPYYNYQLIKLQVQVRLCDQALGFDTYLHNCKTRMIFCLISVIDQLTHYCTNLTRKQHDLRFCPPDHSSAYIAHFFYLSCGISILETKMYGSNAYLLENNHLNFTIASSCPSMCVCYDQLQQASLGLLMYCRFEQLTH